jgi:hypothetical protein
MTHVAVLLGFVCPPAGPYILNMALQEVGDKLPTQVIPNNWV